MSSGAHIETVHSPLIYTQAQVEQACAVAADLERGVFVLTIPPVHDCDTILGLGKCGYCTWRKDNKDA